MAQQPSIFDNDILLHNGLPQNIRQEDEDEVFTEIIQLRDLSLGYFKELLTKNALRTKAAIYQSQINVCARRLENTCYINAISIIQYRYSVVNKLLNIDASTLQNIQVIPSYPNVTTPYSLPYDDSNNYQNSSSLTALSVLLFRAPDINVPSSSAALKKEQHSNVENGITGSKNDPDVNVNNASTSSEYHTGASTENEPSIRSSSSECISNSENNRKEILHYIKKLKLSEFLPVKNDAPDITIAASNLEDKRHLISTLRSNIKEDPEDSKIDQELNIVSPSTSSNKYNFKFLPNLASINAPIRDNTTHDASKENYNIVSNNQITQKIYKPDRGSMLCTTPLKSDVITISSSSSPDSVKISEKIVGDIITISSSDSSKSNSPGSNFNPENNEDQNNESQPGLATSSGIDDLDGDRSELSNVIKIKDSVNQNNKQLSHSSGFFGFANGNSTKMQLKFESSVSSEFNNDTPKFLGFDNARDQSTNMQSEFYCSVCDTNLVLTGFLGFENMKNRSTKMQSEFAPFLCSICDSKAVKTEKKHSNEELSDSTGFLGFPNTNTQSEFKPSDSEICGTRNKKRVKHNFEDLSEKDGFLGFANIKIQPEVGASNFVQYATNVPIDSDTGHNETNKFQNNEDLSEIPGHHSFNTRGCMQSGCVCSIFRANSNVEQYNEKLNDVIGFLGFPNTNDDSGSSEYYSHIFNAVANVNQSYKQLSGLPGFLGFANTKDKSEFEQSCSSECGSNNEDDVEQTNKQQFSTPESLDSVNEFSTNLKTNLELPTSGHSGRDSINEDNTNFKDTISSSCSVKSESSNTYKSDADEENVDQNNEQSTGVSSTVQSSSNSNDESVEHNELLESTNMQTKFVEKSNVQHLSLSTSIGIANSVNIQSESDSFADNIEQKIELQTGLSSAIVITNTGEHSTDIESESVSIGVANIGNHSTNSHFAFASDEENTERSNGPADENQHNDELQTDLSVTVPIHAKECPTNQQFSAEAISIANNDECSTTEDIIEQNDQLQVGLPSPINTASTEKHCTNLIEQNNEQQIGLLTPTSIVNTEEYAPNVQFELDSNTEQYNVLHTNLFTTASIAKTKESIEQSDELQTGLPASIGIANTEVYSRIMQCDSFTNEENSQQPTNMHTSSPQPIDIINTEDNSTNLENVCDTPGSYKSNRSSHSSNSSESDSSSSDESNSSSSSDSSNCAGDSSHASVSIPNTGRHSNDDFDNRSFTFKEPIFSENMPENIFETTSAEPSPDDEELYGYLKATERFFKIESVGFKVIKTDPAMNKLDVINFDNNSHSNNFENSLSDSITMLDNSVFLDCSNNIQSSSVVHNTQDDNSGNDYIKPISNNDTQHNIQPTIINCEDSRNDVSPSISHKSLETTTSENNIKPVDVKTSISVLNVNYMNKINDQKLAKTPSFFVSNSNISDLAENQVSNCNADFTGNFGVEQKITKTIIQSTSQRHNGTNHESNAKQSDNENMIDNTIARKDDHAVSTALYEDLDVSDSESEYSSDEVSPQYSPLNDKRSSPLQDVSAINLDENLTTDCQLPPALFMEVEAGESSVGVDMANTEKYSSTKENTKQNTELKTDLLGDTNTRDYDSKTVDGEDNLKQSYSDDEKINQNNEPVALDFTNSEKYSTNMESKAISNEEVNGDKNGTPDSENSLRNTISPNEDHNNITKPEQAYLQTNDHDADIDVKQNIVKTIAPSSSQNSTSDSSSLLFPPLSDKCVSPSLQNLDDFMSGIDFNEDFMKECYRELQLSPSDDEQKKQNNNQGDKDSDIEPNLINIAAPTLSQGSSTDSSVESPQFSPLSDKHHSPSPQDMEANTMITSFEDCDRVILDSPGHYVELTEDGIELSTTSLDLQNVIDNNEDCKSEHSKDQNLEQICEVTQMDANPTNKIDDEFNIEQKIAVTRSSAQENNSITSDLTANEQDSIVEKDCQYDHDYRHNQELQEICPISSLDANKSIKSDDRHDDFDLNNEQKIAKLSSSQECNSSKADLGVDKQVKDCQDSKEAFDSDNSYVNKPQPISTINANTQDNSSNTPDLNVSSSNSSKSSQQSPSFPPLSDRGYSPPLRNLDANSQENGEEIYSSTLDTTNNNLMSDNMSPKQDLHNIQNLSQVCSELQSATCSKKIEDNHADNDLNIEQELKTVSLSASQESNAPDLGVNNDTISILSEYLIFSKKRYVSTVQDRQDNNLDDEHKLAKTITPSPEENSSTSASNTQVSLSDEDFTSNCVTDINHSNNTDDDCLDNILDVEQLERTSFSPENNSNASEDFASNLDVEHKLEKQIIPSSSQGSSSSTITGNCNEDDHNLDVEQKLEQQITPSSSQRSNSNSTNLDTNQANNCNEDFGSLDIDLKLATAPSSPSGSISNTPDLHDNLQEEVQHILYLTPARFVELNVDGQECTSDDSMTELESYLVPLSLIKQKPRRRGRKPAGSNRMDHNYYKLEIKPRVKTGKVVKIKKKPEIQPRVKTGKLVKIKKKPMKKPRKKTVTTPRSRLQLREFIAYHLGNDLLRQFLDDSDIIQIIFVVHHPPANYRISIDVDEIR